MLKRIVLSAMGLTLVSCIACGCSSGSAPDSRSVEALIPPSAPAADLLPFPVDQPLAADPGRQANVNMNVVLQGDQFLLSNSQAVDTDLILDPETGGGFAYGMYRFGGLDSASTIQTLSVALEGLQSGEDYFFALADYQLARWRIISLAAPSASQNFDLAGEIEAVRHVSPLGNLHMAVISTLPCTLDAITLLANTTLQVPSGLNATDGEFDDRVEISWQTVAGAEGYELFYKQSDEPEEFFSFLTELEGAESTLFMHGAVNPPGKPCLYSEVYDYRVRAVAGESEVSGFSESDSGFRITAPPSEFYASRGIYTEVVELNILGSEEPHTYQIFRDDVLVAILEDVEFGVTHQDGAFGDNQIHEYYVVAIGPEGPSEPTDVEIGFRGNWQADSRFAQSVVEPFYFDMQQSTADPSRVAICARLHNWIGDVSAILYYQYTESGVDISVVSQAAPGRAMSLCNHLGRPWVAFDNTDPEAGPTGLTIARSATASPEDGDWSSMELGQTVLGNQIVMRVVDGRLMVLALCLDAFGEPDLRIAQALVVDPQSPADWSIERVDYGDLAPADLPLYDMAQLGTELLIAAGDNDSLFFLRSPLPTPENPGSWSGHEVFSFPENNAKSIAMIVEDGRPYIHMAGNQLEQSGFSFYANPWNDDPQSIEDWNLNEVESFNDADVFGGSIAIYDGKPLLAWANDRKTTVTIATPKNDTRGFFNGFWHKNEPGPEMGFERCLEASRIVIIDGLPHVSYVGRSELDSDKSICVTRLLPPTLPPG